MKSIRNIRVDARRKRGGWRAPSHVELFDDHGDLLGVVLMARSAKVVGPGAETVYMRRDVQPERLRQSA